jgi:AAA domain-containing protein
MAIQYAQENPFRDCADPGSAIPSSACDRALAALEQAIVAQRSPIVLLGPIGAGKTLLLRRIVDRAPPSIRTIFLPWLNVPAEDVIPWIRAFERAEASEDDFVAAARAFHARGVQTLLLVDEAQSMPRESAVRLAELVSEAGSAVQVVLAGVKGDSMQAAVAAFQGDAEYVELEGEVTPLEVATWAHNTFNSDELSRLRELDWAELVQKVQGIPRLVRWELERRLATGDVAAALGEGTPEALEGGVEPVQTGTPLKVVPLPAAWAPKQATVTARSALQVGLEVRTVPDRLTDRIRRIASRSGAVSREAVHAGRRYAGLLGEAFGQAAHQIRDTATSRTESAAARVADLTAGASASGRAALQSARIWGAHYPTRIVLTVRVAFTGASRRGAAMLRKVVFRTRRTSETIALAETGFTARGVPAIRAPAGRGREHALEPVRVRRRAFLSDPPGSKRPWRIPAGALAVFALAAGGFLLGRMSALPNAGSRAHELLPRAPAIVSSGPPREVGQDKTIPPQPREGANRAHESPPPPPVASTQIASEARAETTTPGPAAKPSTTHKRRLAKRAVHPSPPAAPATEAPPAAPDEGNQNGWVIRRR